MSIRKRRATALVVCTCVALATIAACMRDGNAETAGAASAAAPAPPPDDTVSMARLLAAVRGVDPLLCELAVRSVDMHGSWSHWGPLGEDPLEVDSSASALIRWIQRDHKDPVVVPRLRAAMRDPDACVRRVAGSFLGRVDHASASEALLAALDDPRAETRQVAALGLGLSDKPAAAASLVRRLRDDSPAVRRAAAFALGALESAQALDQLIELLGHDADPRVRQAAAWAIGRIGDG